jgi:hypothetical protein
MKNWKSTLAFFVFVGAYIFTLYRAMDADIIEITGYLALWSAVFMMLRNDLTPKLIEKLIDTVGKR